MSKTVFIIRHAEAPSPSDARGDFDRKLSEKGIKDAQQMGRLLNESPFQADAFISSEADRALNTARLIAKELNFPLREIKTEPALYQAKVPDVFDVISNFEKTWDTVFLFGHNPTFSQTVAKLSGEHFGNMPPCSAIGISLVIDDWEALSEGIGSIVFHK